MRFMTVLRRISIAIRSYSCSILLSPCQASTWLCQRGLGKSEEEAHVPAETVDQDRAAYVKQYFKVGWPFREIYHLMINYLKECRAFKNGCVYVTYRVNPT